MATASQALPLANAEKRPYQQAIARSCFGRDSLIVLPTGLGKTIICALVIARHLEQGQRALVVAPTKPLVEQHASTFREQLPGADVTVITGEDRPEDRDELWRDAQIAVATPQVARNDLIADRLDPGAWDLLVVDEAHRAVGNYAAVTLAEQMRAANARILAATASPGSSSEKIQEVIDNLGIQHIEARGPWDDDVEPYVDPVSIEWVRVGLPNSLEQAATKLRDQAEHHVGELRSMGLYSSRFLERSKLLKLRSRLREGLDGATGKRASRALGHVATALRLLHGIKLVETQSTRAARTYLTELADEGALTETEALQDALALLQGYMGEHPKMRRCASELENHVGTQDDARALVFVQTRETARVLAEALDQRSQLDVGLFVGQSGPDGLSQSEQLERIEALRNGEHNVLVATSVGEEGLDIPSVGMVVFYEAVSSAIRTIQRRGRTGRDGRGRAIVLMARGTSDEAAYWTASKREKRMRRLIRTLQAEAQPEPEPVIRPNPSADRDDEADGPRVLIDHRELNGPMARLLMKEGLEMEPTTVPVGDLVLSNRVVVERKTADDFVESMIDGRLMDQARSLKRSFEAPIFLIEGDPFRARGNVDEAAISGAIAALGGSFGVPVLTVADDRQAASIVSAMARREHRDGNGPPKLRHNTGGRTLEERQRFVLEGLPNVSSTLAQRLLERFGTPGAVFEATEEELRDVRGIGPTTATAIGEVLHEPTETPWRNGTSTSSQAPGSTTPSGTGAKRSGSSRSSATTS